MNLNNQGALGFSGRKATPIIVLALLFLCLSIAYFVAMVHRLQGKREATAEQWRGLVVLLDRDYRRVEQEWLDSEKPTLNVGQEEQLSTQSPALVESIEKVELRHFQQLIDQFRTTVDLATQRKNADRIEEFLRVNSARIPATVSASATLREGNREYNACLSDERNMLTSFGGRLVRIFLVVPELPDFQLGR